MEKCCIIRERWNKKGEGFVQDTFKNNFKSAEKELMSLSVYNVGFQKCESLHQWGPGMRDHYLIHYVLSGKGYYQTEGKIFPLYPGDVFLVYPYVEVTYYADKKEPWEYYWAGFAGTDATTILNATDFSRKSPIIRSHPQGAIIQKQLFHIYEARGNAFSHRIEMTGRLYTALALFVKSSGKKEDKNPSYITYVKKGVDYVYANYSYNISVEDIARYVGISRSHLFRVFRQYTGMSPKEFLSQYRIKQACHLLKESPLSVAAVANSVGFEDSLYFSKAFHKRKGITPSEYAHSSSLPS
jgi:AraC-like DNA-binding protein